MTAPSRPCFLLALGRGAPCPCSCPRALGWWSPPTVRFFIFCKGSGGLTYAHAPRPPRAHANARAPLGGGQWLPPSPPSLLLEERGRSRLVATPFCPTPFPFFCVQGGAGLPMFMRSKLGWWPPLPLFFLSFSWKEGGGLGWLPHPPFCPLTTDPMVERAERQTFAPKVAGSSPTGALCERRGEKTLSGLLPLPPPPGPTVRPRSSPKTKEGRRW